MHLMDTKVTHDIGGAWNVEFLGEDGDRISVRVTEREATTEIDALERAKAMMVEMTAFGTRGGGQSVNDYDALSNGNFDDEEPLLGTRH
jgi:hypothetical protein